MAIDPSLALQVRPPQLDSPLTSLQHAVTIQDIVGQLQERQAIARDREAQAPLRAQQLAAQARQFKETNALNSAFENSVSYDSDAGDLNYDDSKAAQSLKSQGMDYLLPQYQAQKDQRRAAHRTQALGELTNANAILEKESVPIENFLGETDVAKRKAMWPELRTTLMTTDPKRGKMLPEDYDSDVIDPKIQSIHDAYEQTKDIAGRLSDAQKRQQLALTTPEGQRAAIDRELSLAAKANGTTVDKLDQETKDSVIEKVMGTKIVRKGNLLQQSVALRKLGLKLDANGQPVSIPQEELSDRERADLQYRESATNLRSAQEERASAAAELDRLKADPSSPQYRAASERARIAQENVDLRTQELGLKRDTAQQSIDLKKGLTVESKRKIVQDIQREINKRQLNPGSSEAKAVWDEMSGPYNQLGAALPSYEVTQQPGFFQRFFGTGTSPAPSPATPPGRTPSATVTPPSSGGQRKEQYSASQNAYRYSLDGGKTWQPGRLPKP